MDEPPGTAIVAAVAAGPPRQQPTRPGSLPPPAVPPSIDESAEVVSLGAWCDVHTAEEYLAELRGSGFPAELFDEERVNAHNRISFDVSDFAVLADGRCLTLHAERGFSTSIRGPDHWALVTVEDITEDVLWTLLPDDDDTEDDHPWEWLVDLLAAHGVGTTEAHLRGVAYVVELSDRILSQLSEPGSR